MKIYVCCKGNIVNLIQFQKLGINQLTSFNFHIPLTIDKLDILPGKEDFEDIEMPYESQFRQSFKGISKASITSSKRNGWVRIVTPYHKEFIEALKYNIPGSLRYWDNVDKVWEVNALYLDVLIDIMKKHFKDVSADLNSGNDTAEIENIFEPLFDILKDLPTGEMDRVYRALSMALHPDRGGSAEQMKKLNEVMDKYRKK